MPTADEAKYIIQRLTTLSPIRPDRLGALRRRLAFVEWTPGVGRPLLELSTIHYARWIVLRTLPDPEGRERPWPLNWNYLLFHATYDGPQDVYLDTFGDLLPLRIARLFGTCFGFESRVEDAPGAGARVFPNYAFRSFVLDNQLRELAFYEQRADNVRAIRQALEIEKLEQRSEARGAGFVAEQSTVQSLALGAPLVKPSWRESLFGPSARRVRPGRSVSPLTLIAPLEDDAKLLRRHRSASPKKIRGLPQTLFASVALIPRAMQPHLGQQDPDVLPRDYLLFTSEFYGDRADYLDKLRATSEITDIFRQCVTFPGTQPWRFANWVAQNSVNTQYFVSGYPPRSVKEMDRLLTNRAEIAHAIISYSTRRGRP
jgi:hypothetical protein